VLQRAASVIRPDGVLLLSAEAATLYGYADTNPSALDAPARAAVPSLEAARADGWKVSRLDAWTTFHGPGKPALHVGVLDWCEREDLPGLLDWHGPLDQAALIHAWYLEYGVPWAGNPAVVGITLARHLAHGPHDKRHGTFARPRWQLPPDGTRDAWHNAESFRGTSWRPDTSAPHPYQHTFDANRQWLAAAGVTPLAWDALEHTGPRPFDPKAAGMWLVEFERWPHDQVLPDPAGPRAKGGRACWVPTSRLGLVDQLAQRSDQWQHPGYRVLDSYTAPGYTVLKPWADGIRRVLDDQDLSGAVKAVYAKFFTSISRPDAHGRNRRIYRPDWAAGVVGMAQANLWRKLFKVGTTCGRWPVRISADAVAYGSDAADWHDDVPEGLELSDQIGKFKHADTRALEAV